MSYSYIGSGSGSSLSGTTFSVAYSSQSGNTLLVGILLSLDTDSVSGITDDVGNDSTGTPINTWSRITSVSLSGAGKLEVWSCKTLASVSTLNFTIASSAQAQVFISEWNAIGYQTNSYTASSAAATSLTIDATATDAGKVFVGFFGSVAKTVSGFSTGTERNSASSSSGSVMGMAVGDNSITKLAATFNSSGSLLGIGITFQPPVSISGAGSFTDLPDSVLTSVNQCLSQDISAINDNTNLSVARIECFDGYYKHNDVVPLPVSPIDGYTYSRSELTYIWGIRDTVNQSGGWISGADTIWYLAMNVDQNTGIVTTNVGYRRAGSHWNPLVSTDGLLYVVTVAQRKRTSLTLASTPLYVETDNSIYVTDAPATQQMLQRLNDNAKFAAVATEVIPMGEFYNGQTVPTPISPADKYKYSYSEVSFVYSWRWTGVGSVFAQPGQSIGQQGPMKASVSSVGVVSTSVDFIDDSGVKTTRSNYGRLYVFALCSRLPNYFVDARAMPWDPAITGNPTWPDTPVAGVSPIIIKVAPGQTVKVTRTGGTASYSSASGQFDGVGDIPTETSTGLTNFPNQYATTTNTIGVVGIIAAFVDGAGKVVTVTGVNQIYEIGNGPKTLTVPTGAVNLQIGANDNHYGDNSGGFNVGISVLGLPVNNSFLQVDDNQLFGHGLKASTIKQIDKNIKQARLSTEIFVIGSKANGDVISTVTSPVDGYAYQRSEMEYLWEWSDTTNQTGSNLREPAFYGRIDPATGKVILQTYRLPPGGPYLSDNNTLCRINVLVIAHRQQLLSTTFSHDPNPPSDVSSAVVDNNGSMQVNGV